MGGVAVGDGDGIGGVIGEIRLDTSRDVELILLARDDDLEAVGGEGNDIVASMLGNPGESGKIDALGTAKVGLTTISLGCSGGLRGGLLGE